MLSGHRLSALTLSKVLQKNIDRPLQIISTVDLCQIHTALACTQQVE